MSRIAARSASDDEAAAAERDGRPAGQAEQSIDVLAPLVGGDEACAAGQRQLCGIRLGSRVERQDDGVALGVGAGDHLAG